MFLKKFCKVGEVGVIILGSVKVYNILPDLLGNRSSWFSSPVAVKECRLSLFLVGLNQPVNLALSDPKGHSCSFLIAAIVHKMFDYLILLLLIHA